MRRNVTVGTVFTVSPIEMLTLTDILAEHLSTQTRQLRRPRAGMLERSFG